MKRGQLSALFVWMVLLLVALPVLAGQVSPSGGGQALAQTAGDSSQGSDILVSTATGTEEHPDVAYNTADDEYLVVWQDPRHIGVTRTDIYGQLYSSQGIPLGEPIAICSDGGDQWMPAVTYNSTADEYMVIWSEYDDPLLWLAGRRVGADGGLLGDKFQVTLASNEQVYNPDLVYDPNADHYLAVWDNETQGQIEAQLLDSDGTRLLGDPLLIDTAASTPQVAYNDLYASYMVAYELNGDIYAHAIAGDGSLANGPIPLSTDPADQSNPALAFSSAYQGYLVVWEDTRNDALSGHDIYGRKMDMDGNFSPQDILVSRAPEDQMGPAIVLNPDANQYLVVWDDYRNRISSMADIYGQRVSLLGELAEQGNFAISTAPHNQWLPALVYNSLQHQYLVVWADYRATWSADIHGQRLHWRGFPLGYELDISAALEAHEEPAVVYNSTDREYFVVWADDRDGDGEHDIRGQRYDADGRPLLGNFVVREEAGNETRPVIAYNHYLNNYLVVWDDVSEGDIEGQLLNAQGLPIGSAFNIAAGARPAAAYNPVNGDYMILFQVEEGGDTDLYGRLVSDEGSVSGDIFPVYEGPGDQVQPALAFSSSYGEYLAVWSDGRDDPGDIYGRRVYASGETAFDEFVIAAAADAQSFPDLAWNSTDKGFLVVWQDYRDSGSSGVDVYGQRVNNEGALVGNNIAISNASGDQLYPYANYALGNDSYYVGWEDNRNGDTGWDIYGRWVNADGSMGSLHLPTFRYAGWQLRPAGAYNPDDDEGFVVWQDGRNGAEYKIYGRLGVLDRVPPTARFTRQPSVGFSGTTFTLDARSSSDNTTPGGLLLVRWDWTSDGTWDTLPSLSKVVTQTVVTPGVYTVTLGVWDLMLLSDTVAYPIFVLTDTGNVPPTATLAVSPTLAPAGSVFSFDASASTDLEGPVSARWDWQDDGEWDTGFIAELTATHSYTVAGDYTVRVEVQDDEGLTDGAQGQLTVVPANLVELQVLPGRASLMPGDVIFYWAQGWDGYENLIAHPVVQWSVTDPDVGVIDANGTFTTGNRVGDYPDGILGQSDGVTDTASVSIFTLYYRVHLPLVMKNVGAGTTAPVCQSCGVDGVYWQERGGYNAIIRVVYTEP